MSVLIGKNYTISHNNFLQPCYRISPFRTIDLINNINIEESFRIDNYFVEKFENKYYQYTSSGRKALSLALNEYNLTKNDCVTIITTTSNLYISGCVTSEIEKICNWSRNIEENTKVIIVNHEFGFPYENLSQLLDFNIPIIEDCAHSFLSQNEERTVGKVGDFVIYSLPKFFPIQFGGIIQSNKKDVDLVSDVSVEEELYIKKVLSHYVKYIDEIIKTRKKNYAYLEKELFHYNYISRLELRELYCPGVYLFRADQLDLNGLKVFMQEHGVECSVFYGESSFFIPVNQSLELADLDYFIELIKHYRRSSSNVK